MMNGTSRKPTMPKKNLRSRFVLITILIGLIAIILLSYVMNESRREQRIAKAIGENDPHDSTAKTYCGPYWIPQAFRNSFPVFDRVTALRISDPVPVKVAKDGLTLRNLNHLQISTTVLDDDDLAKLKTTYCLESLALERGRFSDKGMVHLQGLINLHFLSILSGNVSDDGLKYLKRMSKLHTLWLNNCREVTDGGLEHLKDLKKLRILGLRGTQVTGVGLKHLKGLTKLEALDLATTNITDAGLQHLNGMTNLQILCLSETQVTDVGLEYLKVMTNVKGLLLTNTKISYERLEALRLALPACNISSDVLAK